MQHLLPGGPVPIDQATDAGVEILVTNFSPNAKDFRDIDYTKPTALVMGNEKTGVSQAMIDAADQEVIIPMVGMVQSLNVSVATGVALYDLSQKK